MSDPDYSNRPSKAVTRRIFMSLLQRLQAFQATSKYRYVGFGAVEFVDFDMAHRILGVKKMTSIEHDHGLIPRCQFNRPFKGIEILEGSASTVLPTLDWSDQSIVWLDYTSKLSNTEMADLENTALLARQGSVVAVTLNCSVSPEIEERVPELEKSVGADKVPLGVNGDRLGGWGLADVQRDLVHQLMERTLSSRGDGAVWQQLLNIHYRDGAPMQLLVGIIDGPEVHEALYKCRFGDMDEVRTSSDSLTVQIPVLTVRERHALNAKLPGRAPTLPGVSLAKTEAYASMYRWLDSTG